MHGIRRVLVFCTLTTILPTMLLVIPLYLRHSFYADVAYAVTESDILEVNNGISTIFCSRHSLEMNGTFNAFQMAQRPAVTSYKKHIRLKKSMNLPDDTMEYWGFYLLKGANVSLSVCSRFEGASILVVKGERNLRTCGMLEHNINKGQTQDILKAGANRQVKIIYESNAQEIYSQESSTIKPAVDIHLPVNVSYENPSSLEMNLRNIMNISNNTQLHNATTDEKELEILFHTAASHIQKYINSQRVQKGNGTRRLRHTMNRNHKINKKITKKTRQGKKYKQHHARDTRIQELKRELYSYLTNKKNMHKRQMDNKLYNERFKRNQELIKPPSLLDQGIKHGGNADKDNSDTNNISSVSSFENGLFNCYGGDILLAHEFEPSTECTNISYLLSGKHMQTSHRIEEDGYYYYIFYSDNDVVSNDIYAFFDIYKPTFQYENVTKSCINQTKCLFSLNLMSSDRVIVEIPTKDGIEHEIDDIGMLISVCEPRMEAYVIFPIAVLFFILGCAFM